MRASSTYSSIVVPQTLTKTMARRSRSSGSFSRTNRCTPMPCSPMAFSMPAGVSTMRGGGCPSRSARNSPLTATPPSVDEIDDVGVFDAVAEAAAGGDERIGQASASRCETERSMSVCQCLPDDPARVEHRAVEARPHEMRRAVAVLRQHDAAVAAAEAAAHDLFERDVAAAGRALRRAARRRASSASGRTT